MRKLVAALVAAFIVFGVSTAPAEAKPPIKVCLKHHWPISKCRDRIVIILPPEPIPYPDSVREPGSGILPPAPIAYPGR